MSFFTKLSTVKKAVVAAVLMTSMGASAQIDSYEVGDMGFLRTPMETANGIIMTNNRYSEIYSLKGNTLTPILRANNCGLYTNLSKDGKYLGFKSFDAHDHQAPAILDVTTGVVTILEDYVWECGQVSFANDGTMAYTMGNSLIIRNGNMRKAFDLGFYTNIANISPDGTQVAYSNIEGQSFIINVATGAKETLPVIDGYRAIWSPDGSKMAIQTANGGVVVRENASKRVFDLGKVESVNWANNSNELVVTRVERKNEFEVTGSSIKRVNFDGSNEITLVSNSNSLPVDAILTSDNQLLIPYKTGAKRGLAIKDLRAGITPMAASIADNSVIKFDSETVFGGRISNPNDNPNIKPNPIPAEGTIGELDIEYLSQIYDSPAVNGCTKHGYVTCAPTSACMHLGYFGLLNKKATTNRYSGATKYYAHAISAVFTNQAGSKTFNETAYGNGCYSVPGGYGYMWTGDNSPGGGRMGTFYTLNGATSATYCWSASTSWSQFCSEAASGRPYPLCIALDSSGHLILGFRTNQYYRSSEGGFVARNGCFVCHDPYGDDNDATWADNDGQHSSYDWLGYNSGRANIGTWYWSIKVGIPANANPGTSTEVGVKCDPASIELSGEVGSSANIYKDVKVTGTGLTTDISVNSATSAITVEKLSGWNDRTGGTLRLKLNTNFSKGAGTYESYVAVQSTSTYRVQIATKVTLTDPAGSTPTPTIAVSPATVAMSAKVGETATSAINVTGTALTGNITASLAGDAAFSINTTSLGTTGGTINVTYKPTAAGTQSATLTLTSDGATAQKVTITGTATEAGSSTPSNPGQTIAKGLTKVWQNTSSVPGQAAAGDVRFAAVSNGKLLVNDKAANTIVELTETGSKTYYDPSAALTANYNQTIGTGIACDDAGNILVNTGFSGAASGSNYTLISADLKSTYKIDLSAIEGWTPGRCDQLGRIRGNMLSSEGGYAFITPNGGTTILVVKVVNGAVDTDYTQVTNPIAGVTLNTSCCPQPAFETVAEIDALIDDNNDLSNAFILRSRGVPGSVFAWNADNTDMVKAWTFSTADGGCTTANASVEGFDWFKLKGKSYFIMPVTTDGTTNTRGSAFAIFDEEGTCVATWTEGEKTGLGACFGSFIAVPINDSAVYIYHFVPGTVAEKFTFAVEGTVGVDGVEVENADAPVKYYNLQGVEVANPSNGIFIKVQGSKATKEYVK
ncbi:MAG: hypothetical protein II990_05340 [Muribaculaceae bacterium]|nr:hypothetical protein [Muribaculaceae bacterium]